MRDRFDLTGPGPGCCRLDHAPVRGPEVRARAGLLPIRLPHGGYRSGPGHPLSGGRPYRDAVGAAMTAAGSTPTPGQPERIRPVTRSEIAVFAGLILATLRCYQDLVAAAQASVAADRDGEPDPLYYIRDELRAYGQLASRRQR